MKTPQISDPDQPVHGAENIAKVLNLVDAKGKPNTRRAFYLLEQGLVDATRMGRRWISTRRRLLGPIVSPRQNVDAA